MPSQNVKEVRIFGHQASSYLLKFSNRSATSLGCLAEQIPPQVFLLSIYFLKAFPQHFLWGRGWELGQVCTCWCLRERRERSDTLQTKPFAACFAPCKCLLCIITLGPNISVVNGLSYCMYVPKIEVHRHLFIAKHAFMKNNDLE